MATEATYGLCISSVQSLNYLSVVRAMLFSLHTTINTCCQISLAFNTGSVTAVMVIFRLSYC